MKQLADFDNFISDTVNLNDTRLDQLDNSFDAIKKFIRQADYKPKISSFYKHGSWAHKTIIKPVDGNAFDADIIVFVKPVDGWTAADYLDELVGIFQASDLYRDKIRIFSHCVTIEYAGERKMDIAPCVIDRQTDDTYEVCNRNTDAFQPTEPEKYTRWINDRNNDGGKHFLRKVARLLKYIRDIKATFTCPSFLMTTLLGMQLRVGDKETAEFSDLSTAFKSMMGRLDDWLQQRPLVPTVLNPVLSSENQASGWTEVQYANFRNQMHRYRQWIDDAYAEQDATQSQEKWQKIFGEDFGRIRKSMVLTEQRTPTTTLDDVVVVQRRGLEALSPLVLRPNWKSHPSWRPALFPQRVSVIAKLVPYEGAFGMRIASGMLVEAHQGIEFTALLAGLPPGPQYRTEWRITNTGLEAQRARALRGEFNSSQPPHKRFETLTYRGVHQAEAFIIRSAENALVGSSEPFYVVVE